MKQQDNANEMEIGTSSPDGLHHPVPQSEKGVPEAQLQKFVARLVVIQSSQTWCQMKA